MPLVMGIDVGTQGARVIICDERGNTLSLSGEPFASDVTVADLLPGSFEQIPERWWEAVSRAVRRAVNGLPSAGAGASDIAAIAVDSTSGTVLPVDSDGNPLRPAIMYSDTRATLEASECNAAGSELTDKLGYQFGASFGLPKILWLMRNEPEVWSRAARVIHAADYISGCLTGDFSRSDTSNAMKTGYDLAENRWPRFISSTLGIAESKLPAVAIPGETVGSVGYECAAATGLKTGTPVVAGVSDGTAGFLASGASQAGDWNSTIGTTLVMRGVSAGLIGDPKGRIYCHRHPDGHWLPGGASNVGAECVAANFPDEDLDRLNREALGLTPTRLLSYPLARTGERLPFVDEYAQGFVHGEVGSREELYTALLEGVAFVERWCLDLMSDLGCDVGDTVYATGGAARSAEWMTIRASVLDKRIVRPRVADAVMGAALVAASRRVYSTLAEATREMVGYDAEVLPDARLVLVYEERYMAFREECARRGLGE